MYHLVRKHSQLVVACHNVPITLESAAKRQRVVSDNESSSALDIVEFLETVSKNENSLKLFIERFLKHQPIRNCLVDAIRSDVIDHLQSRIDSVEYRLDEMEQ